MKKLRDYFANKFLNYKNCFYLTSILLILFFLIFLSNYINSIIIFRVLIAIILSIIIYIIFLTISNYLNRQEKIFLFLAQRDLIRIQMKHKIVYNKGYEISFCFKLIFGILLYFSIQWFVGYIFIFIHESSHALLAIYKGYPILDFEIFEPGRGYIKIPVYVPFAERSQIIIAGSLGSVILGFILIVLITIKRKIPMELFIPLYIIFLEKILSEIDYWVTGITSHNGDAWDFLIINHNMNPEWLFNICSFIFSLCSFILLILLFLKIYLRLIRIMDNIFPNLDTFFID